jgi:UDP-N-acetylmuramate--alanine ligase
MKIERKNIHFVGIGGAGMCGISEVLHNMGHNISGSDVQESNVTKRLTEIGIKVYIGHDASNVKDATIVVYSSAIKKDNPEILQANQVNIPIIGRGAMLAELMAFKKGIAIAGTHGKTTTTSILASIFQEAGLDPTIVIGGKYSKINSNAKLGKGDFLIAEVDESDRSFLKTLPTVAAILNIDPDHINMFNETKNSYENFDEMIAAYSEFVRKIPLLGKVVLNKDEPILEKISHENPRDYIYFSLKDKNATFYATHIVFKGLSSFFTLFENGKKIDVFEIKMLGKHNIMNALAAISISNNLGVSYDAIKTGLKSYDGIDRRLEFLRNDDEQKVLIDYGHHPVEIKHTLETLKAAFPDHKLTVIFQPHRYSRTEYLFKDFTQAFNDADELYITEIYKASETPIPGITGENLAKQTRNANYIKRAEEIFPKLMPELEPRVILFLGAGDIFKSGISFVESMNG